MNQFEFFYQNHLKDVAYHGHKITGRNGDTRQIIGKQIQANLEEGFPIITARKVFPKTMGLETQWMLEGRTNINWLNKRGVKIWDKWADKYGELGPVYGKQLIDFNGINQTRNLIRDIKKNRSSRRHVVTFWNPNDLKYMALPPCHSSIHVLITSKVNIVVTMRSLDLFIGLPYDMGMYAIICSAIAKELNIPAGQVIINAASTHIYTEHMNLIEQYLSNKYLSLPRLTNISTFTDFNAEEFQLTNYKYVEHLKPEVIL